jgi:hypothetical protein
MMAVLILGAGLVILQPGQVIFALAGRDIELVFLVTDQFGKPIPGANITVKDSGAPLENDRAEKTIELITDASGMATWVREESSVEDVIRMFRTKTLFLFTSDCILDVRARHQLPSNVCGYSTFLAMIRDGWEPVGCSACNSRWYCKGPAIRCSLFGHVRWELPALSRV